MERALVLMILLLGVVWVILNEFVGEKKYITNFVEGVMA